MSGTSGPERPGPERPGPDYPPEWDEPAQDDSGRLLIVQLPDGRLDLADDEPDECTCLPHPYGDGPEVDCPLHGATDEWPDDDGHTFVAARTIDGDPDHVECADPRCGERIGNTLAALWAHLGTRHGMTT